METTKLTPTKRSRYNELTKFVKDNLDMAFKIGGALKELQDDKLYLEDFSTFDEFCWQTFQIKRSQAYRVISAWDVRKQLKMSPIGDIIASSLKNESQARQLAKVPEKSRAEVLASALKSGKPLTGKLIQEHAKDKGQVQQKTGNGDSNKAPVEIVLDETGHPVPDKAMLFWNRREEVQELLSAISRIKSALKRAQDDKDLLFSELNIGARWQRISVSLANVYSDLQLAKPYAVCPSCQGKLVEKCTLCGGRGVISKFQFAAVSEDQKKLREMGKKK